MFILKLLVKNAFRHRLRTLLTMGGLIVAISAFGLLRTIVEAWYAGVEATSSSRLITRSAISIGYPLPATYADRLRRTDGVKSITWANWFGGIYIDQHHFFAQFAVDAPSYFKLYPEYRISDTQLDAFLHDRQGAVVGRKLADQYGWHIGDVVPLSGTIYPGTWNFTVRGIYRGSDPKIDEHLMFIHWQRVADAVQQQLGSQAARQVAVFVVGMQDPSEAASLSERIDAQFRNSSAETRTETEKSFQLGFVAMSQAILMTIRAVSFVVILIIMAVMANTMIMTARERLAEYATLKALGFAPSFVVKLLFGESLTIAVIGGGIGMALTFPLAHAFARATGNLFKTFDVSASTLMMQAEAGLLVGVLAALWPAWKMSRIDIVQGLRHVA